MQYVGVDWVSDNLFALPALLPGCQSVVPPSVVTGYLFLGVRRTKNRIDPRSARLFFSLSFPFSSAECLFFGCASASVLQNLPDSSCSSFTLSKGLRIRTYFLRSPCGHLKSDYYLFLLQFIHMSFSAVGKPDISPITRSPGCYLQTIPTTCVQFMHQKNIQFCIHPPLCQHPRNFHDSTPTVEAPNDSHTSK